MAVQDEHHFIVACVFERAFDEHVTISGVLGVVEEVALDETLNEVKEEAVAVDVVNAGLVSMTSVQLSRWVVDAKNLTPKGFGQEVDVALEPVVTDLRSAY